VEIRKGVVKVMDDGTGLHIQNQTLFNAMLIVKTIFIAKTNSMGLPTPEEKISF